MRLVHPFPSVVDGAVTVAIALVAGGTPSVALRLGIAMTSLQFALGALNDLADAARDAGRPEKPLPAGLVPAPAAATVVVIGIAIGLGLSAVSGPATLLVAILGTGAGVAYDLRLKRTPWAWLAYALALPLLPIYAWLGASGDLPPALLLLVPIGVLAGAAISLANGLVHPADDAAQGIRTPVVALGIRGAWRVLAAVSSGAIALALGSLVALGGTGGGIVATALGCALFGIGVVVLRHPSAGRRERGWELVAIGIGMTGAGWFWALANGGALPT